MIKVDLVTGFLGAGKTTFIKKYVSQLISDDEKVGILENDYGAVNVDMILLSGLRGDNCELEMVAGGCDMDCYRRRFKTKLISMAMSGYTRVVIEPSGVFDITEFYDALRESPLDNWYEIGSVFCIVDGALSDELSDEARYVLATQVANSGSVLISRTQDLSKEQVDNTCNLLSDILCKLNISFTPNIITKSWDELDDMDYRKLKNAGFHISDIKKAYDFDELSFESVMFLESGIDINQLKAVAKQLFSADKNQVGNIIRVKGFVKERGDNRLDTDDETWNEINATAREISIKQINKGQEVFIVIGENLKKRIIEEIVNQYCEN